MHAMRKKAKIFIRTAYAKIYSISHPIEKKIFFESFNGRQYSGNPRAISEKMHDLFPEYKLVWFLKKTENKYGLIPDYVDIVGTRLEVERARATSFCIVTNTENEARSIKRKGQFYVQTWHGDRGFKKVLHDVYEDQKRPIPVVDNVVTDVCMSGSAYGNQVYRSAFLYNGYILSVGSARNDCLIVGHRENVELVRKRLGLLGDDKILLYAPTFRDDGTPFDRYKIDVNSTLDALERKDGEKWICIVRLHPAVASDAIPFSDGRIVDVTDYPDMADLLQIADMLITDYSSSACDYVLRRKPVLLAAFDKNDYISRSRSLNVEITAPGFYVAENQKELESYILQLSEKDYSKSCEDVIKFYGTCETGKASEAICKMINVEFEKRHKEEEKL